MGVRESLEGVRPKASEVRVDQSEPGLIQDVERPPVSMFGVQADRAFRCPKEDPRGALRIRRFQVLRDSDIGRSYTGLRCFVLRVKIDRAVHVVERMNEDT
jgi:hypothetical protein